MIQEVYGHEAALAVASTISHAFAGLPAAQYLVPGDPDDRTAWLSVAQPYFAILVEHAMKYGNVYTAADGAAVADWFDGTTDAREPDDYEARRLAAVGDRFVERFAKLDGALGEAHPQGPAHHHLAFLAVLPEKQGHGYGSALMQHHHQVLTNSASTATSSPPTRAWIPSTRPAAIRPKAALPSTGDPCSRRCGDRPPDLVSQAGNRDDPGTSSDVTATRKRYLGSGQGTASFRP